MKLYSDRYKSGEKALSREEYQKLIESISDIQDELLVTMGVGTMLRREDLTSVENAKINLQDRTLFFHEHKKDHLMRHPKKPGQRLGDPIIENGKVVKQEKWRTIDLQPKLVTLIEKYWKTMSKEERKRKYLFTFRGRQAYNRFNAWCKVVGIPERPIHSLRATGIKFCHAAGWLDEEIAKITGDSIATIQAHYMVPSVSEMREVTEKKTTL